MFSRSPKRNWKIGLEKFFINIWLFWITRKKFITNIVLLVYLLGVVKLLQHQAITPIKGGLIKSLLEFYTIYDIFSKFQD